MNFSNNRGAELQTYSSLLSYFFVRNVPTELSDISISEDCRAENTAAFSPLCRTRYVSCYLVMGNTRIS